MEENGGEVKDFRFVFFFKIYLLNRMDLRENGGEVKFNF